MEKLRRIQATTPRNGRHADRVSAISRKTVVVLGLVALTLSSGCIVMRGPVPHIFVPFETIPSDCKEVHSRYAILQTVLRDTLRECAADPRQANPACARIDTTTNLTGLYEAASDRCRDKGEIAGLPSAGEQSAIRDEIATLSARIDRELR